MFKKLRSSIVDQKRAQTRASAYRQLIRREARIGGQLFGPVPAGRRREFFCLDEHTWIWHEEWIDGLGERRYKTTRYDVRPTGILKAQDGQGYQYVSPEEATNLLNAAKLYRKRVFEELYQISAN